MLIPNSDYVEKYCDLAEEIFSERHNITFDSIDELNPYLQEAWEDCVWQAQHYMALLGIKQDLTK